MSAYEALQPLFEPKSIAVVGVSRSGKQGSVFLHGLLDPGFDGEVYVVNPSATEIMGVRSYPSIAALPRRPDLAVLVLPAEPAIDVVRQCAEAGVPGAALFTAGFNEAGTAEGDARARTLLEAAAGRTRLVGPNGMGLYNPRRGIAMFGGMPARVGGVGLISQSGSLVQFLVRAVNGRGLGFSKAVSMGNQLDLNAADFLDYFADDPETTVIGAYVEGVPDGRRFLESLRHAAASKPVILWKAGRGAGGARAARSHTGQLAGEHRMWQGIARQAEAVLVREAEELVDTLVAASALGAGRSLGRRVAIVTGPGGPAVSASDACEESGLVLAELSDQTRKALAERMPAAGTSARNPVDVGMVLVGATGVYGECLRIALADSGVDAALVIGGDASDPQGFAEMLAEASLRSGKPVLYALTGDFGPSDTAEFLAAHGVATAPSAERALRAYLRIVLSASRESGPRLTTGSPDSGA
jgi:acyl-CoA synthetase (NDP forming)